MKLIFDCYMLLHSQYSGIPNMACCLIKEINRRNIDCIYSIGYFILQRHMINNLLELYSGKNVMFDIILAECGDNKKFLSQNDFNQRIYFSSHTFSCVKTKGLGKARVIHDLTPINFPQFHTSEVTEIEGSNLKEDISDSDLIITISESSRIHLQKYFMIPKEKIAVCKNGIAWSKEQIANCSQPVYNSPYVLILGTLEPRKNLALIAAWFTHNAQLILQSELTYIIAGPKGWGEIIPNCNREILYTLIEAKKIVFAGYVPEKYKMSLLAGAKFLIYPSFCEGFGLPIAEALSVGTPVVTSYGGALPEIGGNVACYFSPFSEQSLDDALNRINVLLKNDTKSLRNSCINQAKYFTLERYADQMLSLLDGLYQKKVREAHNI